MSDTVTENWVYIKSEPGLWTVGFYSLGRWEPDSDHSSAEEAAKRVHYLNGGNSVSDTYQLACEDFLRLAATSGTPAPQDDPMSADWRAGYEKAKTTFYSQGFTDGAQHEESRLRAVRNDVADSLGDVLALFDDEGAFRESYQDQASVVLERAEANLRAASHPLRDKPPKPENSRK